VPGHRLLSRLHKKKEIYPALETGLEVGLLLPCNVIVYETDDEKAYVAAINPVSALDIIKNRELQTIAEELSEKLKRAIEKASG